MNCSNAVEIYCLYPISVYSIKEVSLARYYLSGQRLQHEAVSLWWWTSYNLTQVFTVFTVCFFQQNKPCFYFASASVFCSNLPFTLCRLAASNCFLLEKGSVSAAHLGFSYYNYSLIERLYFPLHGMYFIPSRLPIYVMHIYLYILWYFTFFIHSYDSPIHVILNFAFHLEFRDVGQCDSHNNSDEYNNG